MKNTAEPKQLDELELKKKKKKKKEIRVLLSLKKLSHLHQ